MIKETILKFLIQHEEQSDGVLKSLLAIIRYYNGNTSSINLNAAIQNNYLVTSISSLVKNSFKM